MGKLITFSEKQNLNNVLDCFILTKYDLLFFIKDCNEMGTILHYASQEVVFCENSLKNWPHLLFTKMQIDYYTN